MNSFLRLGLMLGLLSIVAFSGDLAAGETSLADSPADDDGRDGIDFFESRIRPVLARRCFKCHSSRVKKPKGGLRLDTITGLRDGGESGPAISRGRPEQSLLIDAIRFDGLEMPPGDKLTDQQIADFTRWISIGAPVPMQPTATPSTEQAETFWSFVPARRPPVPPVDDAAWPSSEIDHFIRARQERLGLKPVRDADRAVLLRRLTFDLTGLPPTWEQQQEFRDDRSPDAVERLVDRLLMSPHFGERWGRFWLDAVRFAESNGGDRNVIFPHAWRFRDYVIDAHNADRPYDQFLREQIAGDLLPFASPAQRDRQRVATGMLTLGPKLFMETKSELFRMDVVDEQIDVISRGVLGLTASCARCHDHKFDPIPTRDYYALAGILRSTQLMYGPAAPAGNQYGHDRPLQPIGENAEQLAGPAKDWQQAVADQTAGRNKARSDRYRVVRKKAAQENKLKMAADPTTVSQLKSEIERLAKEIAEWDEKIKRLDEQLAALTDNPPPLPDYAMAVRDHDQVEDCRVRIGGRYNREGKLVPRGFLTAIGPGSPPVAQTSGRRELAEWLTKSNPLTARVAVNRVWQKLFGAGLVRSVDNFGYLGDRPTHPRLLDWLAVQFEQDGWSTKRLIRRLVLSRTYRLTSDPAERSAGAHPEKTDPENRLLWRMNYRRLDAESIRDAMLQVAGELDRNRPAGSVVSAIDAREFNATVRLAPKQQESNHRTVYLPVVRLSVPEMLTVFNFADPSLVVAMRNTRPRASQQLFLLNSAFSLKTAEQAARRLLNEAADDDQRIDIAWRRFFGRLPAAAERRQALDYVVEEASARGGESPRLYAWTSFCQAMLASAEFRFLD